MFISLVECWLKCYKWRNVELWVHTFIVWHSLFHIAQEYWQHRTIFQLFSSSFWETLLFSDKRFSKIICNICTQLTGRVVRISKCDCERKEMATEFFFFSNLGLYCSCIFSFFYGSKISNVHVRISSNIWQQFFQINCSKTA